MLSVADALALMLGFGSFVLSLVEALVIITKAVVDQKKDRR